VARYRARAGYARDLCVAHSDAFSGKCHLSGATLQNLNQDIARCSHKAGSDTRAYRLDRLDDIHLAAHQMRERRIQIVDHERNLHHRSENVESAHAVITHRIGTTCNLCLVLGAAALRLGRLRR